MLVLAAIRKTSADKAEEYAPTTTDPYMKLFARRLLPCCLLLLFACNEGDNNAPAGVPENTLTEEQKRLASNALSSLVVADGLHAQTMAAEPMLVNPTNIDVDERGRVWVTEAYNYRPDINGNPSHPAGDRILILEDHDGDGVADTAKVFYQSPEINAPLGICVLGNRVLISQSPYIWSLYDDDGDDKADRKEILFQGIGGEQHDHGVHAVSFGPDGKLYFEMGNYGETLKDKNGRTVRDQDGDEIGPAKYRQGMVFRCDPDGSNVECLGHNFRNNYEAAVDSYGTVWQSDNDDDGNRGVRINYVMEYGNYGYTDELTGAGWQANRTNMEDSIPLRHWHLNDPGVAPNVLQTGAGSPTGMAIYEGSLLPEPFRGQMIHADAGVNVVRAYPVQKNGAGYTAGMINILKNEGDQWFRPADVCVAPDGSLIVADWYDPGVGGHAAGDQQRGRIYRVAPTGAKYIMPVFDYTTPSGALQALQNPNLSVRHHAYTALLSMGEKALPELERFWQSTDNDPRMRARVLWALVKMPGINKAQREKYIGQAIGDSVADLRITGIRAARQSGVEITGIVSRLINDPDMQTLRECALALRHCKNPAAAGLWASLATRHNGNDRWYLEALGIGADKQWDRYFAAFVSRVKDPLQNPGYRDIVWRARCEQAVPYLAKLATEPSELHTRLRYFRAFDFHAGPSKSGYLVKMLEDTASQYPGFNKLVLTHLDPAAIRSSVIAQRALRQTLASLEGTPEYLEMVRRYALRTEGPRLMETAINYPRQEMGRTAAEILLDFNLDKLVWDVIQNRRDTASAFKLLQSLAGVGNKKSVEMLRQVAFSEKYDNPLRQMAARQIGGSGYGEEIVVGLLDNKNTPDMLKASLASGIKEAWSSSIRAKAALYLPAETGKPAKKIPELAALQALKADPVMGATVFKNHCAVCHQVKDQGFDFGPKLTEIGSKLPKEALLDAILQPSAGISFGYEGWELSLKDGSTVAGIISSQTADNLTLKFPGGQSRQIKTSDVVSKKALKESMMTSGLYESLSDQEMADLLEFLAGLKRG